MKKVIISGGGTGGHIYPAVAIAQEIKKTWPEADILFVGAKGRMEMEKVPRAGFPIVGLWISGLQRKLTWGNLLFPLKVLSSLLKSYQIIKKFKPDVAIGVGGYASGPLLYMAGRMGIPTLIHEQNSYPGLTNKWLSKRATRICVAYQNMTKWFPSEKVVVTGNPVREDILNPVSKQEAASFFGLDTAKPILLIIGGSLGARTINQAMGNGLKNLMNKDIQVIWQTGAAYYEQFKQYNQPGVVVKDFVYEMQNAYSAADVVISRAGAGSVTEISVCKKPTILVPSPWVAEDHQTFNAKALTDNQAAILVTDLEASQGKMIDEALRLLGSPEERASIVKALEPFNIRDARQRIILELRNMMS